MSLCAGTFRFYLAKSGSQLKAEFYAQNISELASSDVYAIASRLNQLSGAFNWTCIKASRDGNVFFERRRGLCSPLPWQEVVEINNYPVNDISITITARLPSALEHSFALFVLFQFLLLISLIYSSKSQEREKHQVIQAKLAIEAELGRMISQVSHDIRSPLAVLQTLVHSNQELDLATKKQIKGATQRIQDIARSLLDKGRSNETRTHDIPHDVFSDFTPSSEEESKELLAPLIEEIVSERQLLLKDESISIKFLPNQNSLFLFATTQPIEFSRILTNLLNNAVESIENSGTIELVLMQDLGKASITISDNGKGISSEHLERIGKRGFTFGKKDGNGLGIYHAKKTLEHWGGKLSIHSETGKGTTVTLELPITPPPDWFAQEVEVPIGCKVVIIDDDPCVHFIWKQKLKGIQDVQIIELSNPEEALSFYRKRIGEDDAFLYLCDLQLQTKQDGLDIISMLGLESNAVLVTNDWDNSLIHRRAKKLGVKIIPKNLIDILPIVTTGIEAQNHT